jgi:type IV pilus assembly protein PilV
MIMSSGQRSVERCSARGFSLVEVLVALVILSVGMLGIAALYVESLRSGRTALFRTQAVTLASDIADRIRANPSAKAAYAGTITSSDTVAACAPGGAGCTAEELAKHDTATWLKSLESTLPGGSGTIQFDNTTVPATYTITITWTEPGQAEASTYQIGFQA